MRKLILAFFMLLSIPMAFATEGAKIKIRVSGPIYDNRYFMCIPDIGCLSIKAAKKGKVFKLINGAEMNTIFITDLTNRRLHNQGLPRSCNVKLEKNKTITIYGELVVNPKRVNVNNLRCSVSNS